MKFVRFSRGMSKYLSNARPKKGHPTEKMSQCPTTMKSECYCTIYGTNTLNSVGAPGIFFRFLRLGRSTQPPTRRQLPPTSRDVMVLFHYILFRLEPIKRREMLSEATFVPVFKEKMSFLVLKMSREIRKLMARRADERSN